MNDNSDIDGARQVVARALEKYQTDRAGLLAHDGVTPIDPPATFAMKQAKLLESVEWAVERATALSDKVAAEVEAQRLAPFADPTSALSPSDLQDANLRAQWIREDCETLPLGDLAERLRAVHHDGGSKSSVFVHDRYARARWKAESDKVPQSPDLAVFAQTLRGLGVIGDRAGLSSEAQKRQEAAQSLRRWAQGQLQAARNPEQVAADKAKFAQSVRGMF